MRRITAEQLDSVTQIFKSNIATLQADDNTPCRSTAVLVPYKHFFPLPSSLPPNVRSRTVIVRLGKWELLTVFFMSDPDLSQEGCGLAVTPPSRCFHAKGEKKKV